MEEGRKLLGMKGERRWACIRAVGKASQDRRERERTPELQLLLKDGNHQRISVAY